MAKERKPIRRTIILPEALRDAAAKRAAAEKRSLQQHIVYLLEQDVKAAKMRRQTATA